MFFPVYFSDLMVNARNFQMVLVIFVFNINGLNYKISMFIIKG